MRAKDFIINEGEYHGPFDHYPPYSSKGFNRVPTRDNEAYVETEDMNQLANNIRMQCAPFLQHNKALMKDGFFLYRGVKGADPRYDYAIEGSVRQDRSPRDTTQFWHTFTDKYFQQEFGWPYRSASLFVASDPGAVNDYGPTYMIFPIGQCTLCYSPKVQDFTVDVTSNGNSRILQNMCKNMSFDDVKNLGVKFGFPWETHDDILKSFRDFIHGPLYQSSIDPQFRPKFQNFLLEYFYPRLEYSETESYAEVGDSEVMIKCSTYYGIVYPNASTQFKSASQHLLRLILQ